eukprot:TRINITY_DN50035_c0_g1_i2.p1 TRINITY_DN50035_c0_g1~~TRINITY_DN50035_c0_g1_i2.p1  ORF type:complete len:590 (+),score=122.96 TRINITY_DN50035_c0_g1_i2:54-1823(+)
MAVPPPPPATAAEEICWILQQREAAAAVAEDWEAICRGLQPGPSEKLACETAAKLIGQAVADMRSSKANLQPGQRPDIMPLVSTLRGLYLTLCLQPCVGPRVLSLLGMCDSAYAWLAMHLARAALQPPALTVDEQEEADAARLPVMIFVACAGPDVLSGVALLELAAFDLVAAVAAATAALRPEKHAGRGIHGDISVALARALQGLTTPAAFMAGLQRSSAPDTAETSIDVLNDWQMCHLQNVTLSLIQFDSLAVAAAAGDSADARAGVAAALLSLIGALVSRACLAGTAQLLGRHLAVHFAAFGHRLLAPLMRRLLSASEAGKPAAAANSRALRAHLRTIRWLLHHSSELRPLLWPLCSEWFLRAARYGSVGSETSAAALAAVAFVEVLPEPVIQILASLDDDERQALRSFITQEAALGPIETEAWRCLASFGLWDNGAELCASASYASEQERASSKESADAVDALGDADVAADAWRAETEFEVHGSRPLGPCAWPGLLTSPVTDSGGSMTVLRTAPAEYRCAIDGRICREPCRSPTGVLFERKTIEAWLRSNPVCAVSGVPLVVTDLLEDAYTRDSIAAWLIVEPCD